MERRTKLRKTLTLKKQAKEQKIEQEKQKLERFFSATLQYFACYSAFLTAAIFVENYIQTDGTSHWGHLYAATILFSLLFINLMNLGYYLKNILNIYPLSLLKLSILKEIGISIVIPIITILTILLAWTYITKESIYLAAIPAGVIPTSLILCIYREDMVTVAISAFIVAILSMMLFAPIVLENIQLF